MSVTDPNPTTNPAMELQCMNCYGMYREVKEGTRLASSLPYSGYPSPPPTWVWHVPAGGGATDLGTEVGGFSDFDPSVGSNANIEHPHCPNCGSHSVRIVKVIEPS